MLFRFPPPHSSRPVWLLLIGVAAVVCAGMAPAQDADGDLLPDASDPYPQDPFNGGWRMLTTSDGSEPLLRHEGDGCRIGDQFLVLGGRETDVVEFFDPVANTWRQTSEAPVAFSHCQAVQLNGRLYVVGAFTGTYPDEVNVPNVYIYNVATDEWTKGPLIPTGRRRGAAAAVAYNGKIYLAGGNTKGHRAGYVAWFDEFDPSTGTWKEMPNAPQARDHHRAVLFQDRMYLLAGRRSVYDEKLGGGIISNTVKDVDVFDFKTGVWFTMPNAIPTPRAGCGVLSHGRDFIVAGGENGNGANESVEALDAITGAWRVLPKMNQRRNGPVAEAFGNTLYVFGGQDPENTSMETLLLPPRPLPPGTTGLLGAPFAAQLQPVVAINCGGKGAAEFTEDVNVSGGAPVSTDAAITGAAAAPEAVYKTQRSGDCTYVISGLDPKSCYRLELHFAELVFNANGQRTFDVTINGVLALSKFDVYRSATAKNKAVTHVFSVVPDSLGSLTLGFTSGVNEATVAGVSVAKVIRFPVSSPGFSLVKPYDVLARAGDPVSFASRINGKSPTLFQWRRNGTSVTGATRTIFSIPEVTLAQAGSYSVLAGGTVAGPAASLIVAGEASFSRSVQPGGTGWLTVPFAGAGASFRWLLNGNPLSDGNGITGARTNKLTIGGFKLGNEGDYQCVVSAFGDSETFGPYNIHLMRPPELTNGAPPDAIIIGTFKWQLTSNESQTSYAVTGLPPGLVYNPATATISGTATKSGFYNISVVPSNPAGIGPLKTFVLKVEPVPISVRGNFAGLIDRQSTVNGNLGGSLRFTVGSTGLLSGRLVNGKVEYSFTGRLSGTAGGDPSCKVRILRAIGSPLDLFFTLQRSDGSMTGSLGVGTALALLRGRPVAVTSAAATSTELNCFLGLVDAQDVGNAAMPQGTGWMRVPRTIGNGGIAVSGTGRLPDGTPVSFSSNECADGEVPVFMILPAGNGSVLGWFQIDAQSPSLQTLGGTLNWRKTGPSSSTDYTYRSGINVNLSAEGITYQAPAVGTNVLGGGDTPGNARIEFSQAGLASAAQGALVNQTFRLTAEHTAIFGSSSVNPAGVTLTVDPVTGTFSGTFRLKDGSTVRNVGFGGIFAGSNGEGYFKLSQLPLSSTSPVQSGLVRIFQP